MTRFLACFPVSKFRKRRRLVSPTSHQISRDESDSAIQSKGYRKQQDLENPINLVTGSEKEIECHYKSNKKVKFDLKVSTFDEEVKVDLNVSAIEEEKSSNKETGPRLVERAEIKEGGESEEALKEASSVSFALHPLKPHSYRYANSTQSDEEKSAVEESSESLFSLSIDSRRRVSVAESDDSKEVNSPIPSCKLDAGELNQNGLNQSGPGRTQFVDSVLGSDEQLRQSKAMEEKASTKFNHQDQENISPARGLGNASNSSKPALGSKVSLTGKKLAVQETVVDASLSSWLVESEKTTLTNSNTDQSVVNMPSGGDAKPPAVSRKDRPVLGELGVKKPTRQSATRSSSRPCESQKPVAGTIGSYRCHTGQAVDSDSNISFGTPRTRSINKEVERAKWRELWKELSAQI